MKELGGEQFGRYLLQDKIGQGGMAWVYRATDTLLQRPVALKILVPQLHADSEFVQRFEREAVLVANLHHPAIVRIYDIGKQDQFRYIAMELIDGCTLAELAHQHGPLGLGYVITILEPIAQALAYAHSQKAIHRDIKPQNIMLDSQGRVLLTDFGIAQRILGAETEKLTQTGTFIGTPEYLAPEQAETRPLDGRCDLYALGIVAYELLTGRVPFTGTVMQLIVAHIQTIPAPPSLLKRDLPLGLDAILLKALAKNPQDRFTNVPEFVAALREVARLNGIPLASIEDLAALVVLKSRPSDQVTLNLNSSDPTVTVKAFAPRPFPAPAFSEPAFEPAKVKFPSQKKPKRSLFRWVIILTAISLFLLFLLLRGYLAKGSLPFPLPPLAISSPTATEANQPAALPETSPSPMNAVPPAEEEATATLAIEATEVPLPSPIPSAEPTSETPPSPVPLATPLSVPSPPKEATALPKLPPPALGASPLPPTLPQPSPTSPPAAPSYPEPSSYP